MPLCLISMKSFTVQPRVLLLQHKHRSSRLSKFPQQPTPFDFIPKGAWSGTGGCTLLVPKPTDSISGFLSSYVVLLSLMHRRHAEKKTNEWKDHRLPSVPLSWKCYVECSPAAAFASQMGISPSPSVWHEPTLLHGTHVQPALGSFDVCSYEHYLECVWRPEESFKLHTLLPRAGPFPELSTSSAARQLKLGGEETSNQSQMWGPDPP